MSKTLAIEPAQMKLGEQGESIAPLYGDDGPASRSHAWDQARAIFIEGCGLPERVTDTPGSTACLRLLETGFGLGINFLATWAWLREAERTRSTQPRFHYVSIEKHPFTQQDLRHLLALNIAHAPAELAKSLPALAERLLAVWPPLIPGFHTLVLDEQTTLTLVFGDIDKLLPAIGGKFDAFYLDGLAPDRNPVLGPEATLAHLGALAAPGASVASRYVADNVPQSLASAGFEISKHDSRFARWPGARTYKYTHTHTHTPPVLPVVVVGAGIAGASVARQLAGRGLPVTVIELDQPATGASGNPVAVVRPEPGNTDNPIAEFSAAGVGWLRRWLAMHGAGVPHEFCGALRMTRDRRRHDKLAAYAQTMPETWLREVDVQQGAALCGQLPAGESFFLPEAGWVQAAPLVAAMLDHPLIHLQIATRVLQLSSESGKGWTLALSDGRQLQAATVVLANAFGGLSPVKLPLDRARGQLSSLPERAGRALQTIVCRDGYITPAVHGVHTIGATMQYDDEDGTARAADDVENFERLQRLLPGFAQSASELQSGRVSWRATTQDRLPLVGKLDEGLYASLGHGSRGIACGPLCAEFLAALMLDEPLPLGREWVGRLDPLRFV